jgi:hypothetical protein
VDVSHKGEIGLGVGKDVGDSIERTHGVLEGALMLVSDDLIENQLGLSNGLVGSIFDLGRGEG